MDFIASVIILAAVLMLVVAGLVQAVSFLIWAGLVLVGVGLALHLLKGFSQRRRG